MSTPGDEAEADRLRALAALEALDGPVDPRFDRIVRLAARLFDAPMAGLVLVDRERVWLKASLGFVAREQPRADTLSAQLEHMSEPLLLEDARADPRFSAIGSRGRFFAAAPLRLPDGLIVGVLSVGDAEPRPHASRDDLPALADLADLAMTELLHDAETARARRRAKLDKERVDLALQAAGMGEFELDLSQDRLYASPFLLQLMGLPPGPREPGQGADLVRFIHPDDVEAVRTSTREQLAARGRYRVEYRAVRPSDSRELWMAGTGVLVAADGDTPERVIGVVRDITVEKRAEEQRETLLAELDHRVKNVLAAVQSLAAQSARKAYSLDAFLRTFAGRLKAMASAHELLTATRWRGAAVQYLAAAELGGLAPGQTRWEGPDVVLTPRAANAMSLALHELATNAVKYGALSVDGGRVDVRWRLTPQGGVELVWRETGGPTVTPPARRGFGSTLLERVTGRELGGEARIDFKPQGVEAVLRADASALAEQAQATPPPEDAPTAPAVVAGASTGDPTPQAAGDLVGVRVLIVEDAVLLALELEAGLAEAGAEIVGVAAEVDEALALLAKPLDIAVLDANLNGASVQPVAERLAAQGTPFIFATGYGDNRGAPTGFDAPVIRKPYHVNQVAAALGELMVQRRGQAPR